MNRSDIKKLREKQQQITAEARAFTDQITDETPVEEQRELEVKFDGAMADFDAIESKIERGMRLIEAEERSAEAEDEDRRPGSRDNRSSEPGDRDEDADKWDAGLAFRTYCAFGADAVPPEHRHLLQGGKGVPEEIRGLVVGTAASGGYTVPEGFSGELEKALQAWGPMLDPGITRVMETDTGNTIKWPTVDDLANGAEAHAEGGAVTDDDGADPTFGEKQLDAYVYDSEVVRVSLELMQDSFFDLDSILGELLGERMGRNGNSLLTTGTGSGQPNGIATAATSGVTAASATAITLDELIDLIHSIDPAYRQSPALRMMFNDTTLAALRKIKDSDGNYIWQQANAQVGQPASIFGYSYTINQAMPTAATTTTPIVFGDLSKYVVRKVREITVVRMNELFAKNLEVGFMAYNRIDGELINTAAVKKLTMA